MSEATIDAKLTMMQQIQTELGESVNRCTICIDALVNELQSAIRTKSEAEKERALLRALNKNFNTIT